VISAYARVEWVELEELEPTARGEAGFGSTGIVR
jgi:dUTPase